MIAVMCIYLSTPDEHLSFGENNKYIISIQRGSVHFNLQNKRFNAIRECFHIYTVHDLCSPRFNSIQGRCSPEQPWCWVGWSLWPAACSCLLVHPSCSGLPSQHVHPDINKSVVSSRNATHFSTFNQQNLNILLYPIDIIIFFVIVTTMINVLHVLH